MHPLRGVRLRSVRLAVLILAGAVPAAGQIPDTFTNLQVLPAHTSKSELVGIMRGYAGSLHVRCLYCHVGEKDDLTGADFASDEKETKRVAREMMRMVKAINGDFLPKTGRDPAKIAPVHCVTCHHGLLKPQTLMDVLREALAAGGVEAAIAKYRELRAQYYGEDAYNFGQGPLNMIGEELMREGKPRDAIALLELNAEMNPTAPYPLHLLGEAYLAAGERDTAIARFRKSLEIAPDNAWTRKRLDQVLAEPPPPSPAGG